MKIVISDVHPWLKLPDEGNRARFIGVEIKQINSILVSAHEYGSICIHNGDTYYSGVYVTCLDDEGYPL